MFQELDEAIHNLDRFLNPTDEHKWINFHRLLNKISGLVSTSTASAFIQLGVDYDGNLFALDEYYCGTNRLIQEHAFDIRNVRARYAAEQCTLFDPGAEAKVAENSSELQSILSAFAREQLPVVPAQRTAVSVGIDLIKASLRFDPQRKHPFTGKSGSPKLFISKQRCPNLWREMIGLRYESGNGSGYVGADCAVSGLRHVLMSRPCPPERIQPTRMPEHYYSPTSWMG